MPTKRFSAVRLFLAFALGFTSLVALPGVGTPPPASVTSVLGWFSVKDYGAKGDNSTDDTVAIQSAVNACAAAGGGWVYFPPGVYLVSGALQTTNLGYSQIVLPSRSYTSSKLFIGFRGPAPFVNATAGQTAAQPEAAVIRSTLTSQTFSGTYGLPSVIGGATLTRASTASFTNWPNLFIRVEDLTVRLPSNPSLAGLNLSGVQCAALHRVRVDTADAPNAPTTPTHPTGCGVMMPANNNNALCFIDEVQVSGFYGGIGWGEHTTGGNLFVSSCYVGLFPVSTCYHGARLGYVSAENCAYSIAGLDPSSGVTDQAATPQLTPIEIGCLDLEDDAGDLAPVGHIRDGNNAFLGTVRYLRVAGGSGLTNGLTVTGCGKLQLVDVGAAPAPTIAHATDAASAITQLNLLIDAVRAGRGVK